MKFLCQWFGHKPPASFSQFAGMGGGNYLKAEGPIVDGVGREHYRLYGMCPRCGEDYQVAMIHGHQISHGVSNES